RGGLEPRPAPDRRYTDSDPDPGPRPFDPELFGLREGVARPREAGGAMGGGRLGAGGRRGVLWAGPGRAAAGPELSVVPGVVPPRDGDLRRGGPRLLEAAGRRLGAALLLALRGDRGRLHGGLPLVANRGLSPVDLRLRRLRGLRPGDEPAFLPRLPAPEPDP